MYSNTIKENMLLLRDLLKLKKNRIYKHMTAISKNVKVYFNILDDIVDNCNNKYHRTIKTKPLDVKSDSYVENNEEYYKKEPKFKVGDHVRISKYENTFAKGYAPNWSEEVFVISKIKTTVR